MRIITIICIVGLLAACSYNSYNEREIQGEWFSSEWIQGGKYSNMKAWMKFNPDSTYMAVFDQNVETGSYWIDGHKLYTQDRESETIVVKIEELTENELKIGMNRGGVPELIVFGRAQK